MITDHRTYYHPGWLVRYILNEAVASPFVFLTASQVKSLPTWVIGGGFLARLTYANKGAGRFAMTASGFRLFVEKVRKLPWTPALHAVWITHSAKWRPDDEHFFGTG